MANRAIGRLLDVTGIRAMPHGLCASALPTSSFIRTHTLTYCVPAARSICFLFTPQTCQTTARRSPTLVHLHYTYTAHLPDDPLPSPISKQLAGGRRMVRLCREQGSHSVLRNQAKPLRGHVLPVPRPRTRRRRPMGTLLYAELCGEARGRGGGGVSVETRRVPQWWRRHAAQQGVIITSYMYVIIAP